MRLLASIFSFAYLLSACNPQTNRDTEVAKAKQSTIDSMKFIMAKQAIVDSMKTVNTKLPEQTDSLVAENDHQVVVNNNIPSTPVKKKKKWNNTAKGAVIGAGAGAVTGALVNKKHAKGALVGGLIGGGVGAATGAIVDYNQKKKSQAN